MLCWFLPNTKVNQPQVHILYTHSLLSLPTSPTPSCLSRLSQSSGLSSLCPCSSCPLAISHKVVYICQYHFLNSSHPPLPPLVHKSVCYACVSIPALKIGSSVSFCYLEMESASSFLVRTLKNEFLNANSLTLIIWIKKQKLVKEVSLSYVIYNFPKTTPPAAKSLQSCPTLCDPIDASPPGSPVPGILQARVLEWVAISFSNAWKWKVKVKSLSRVQPSVTPWTAVYQAPLPMGFSRQEYWSGVPLPSPLLLLLPYIITYTEKGIILKIWLSFREVAFFFFFPFHVLGRKKFFSTI